MTLRISTVALLAVLLAGAVPAQAQQSFDINLGYFGPRSEEGRINGDVLVINRSYLAFDIDDLGGFYGEAAWSVELGKYFEASLGAGFYQGTAPSVYLDYVNENGREIYQELKLRNIPVTGLVRIFPVGQRRAVQPYVGGGVALNIWQYSETGEFVDFWDDSIYRADYVANGTSFGPVGLAGVRARVAGSGDLGVEWRYTWGEGELNEDFLGEKIDLGGWMILTTLKLRF
jgi:outer membrane protein W